MAAHMDTQPPPTQRKNRRKSPATPMALQTKQQTAAALNLSIRALENLMAARAIEHLRIGGAVRFEPDAIRRFKTARTVTAK